MPKYLMEFMETTSNYYVREVEGQDLEHAEHVGLLMFARRHQEDWTPDESVIEEACIGHVEEIES